MVVKKKKTASARQNVVASSLIKVTMARLGDALQTYPMEKGSTVKQVLDRAGLNGDVTTVRLNGKTVTNLDQRLNSNCEIVAVAQIDQGV